MKTAKLLFILLPALTSAGLIFSSSKKSNHTGAATGTGHLQVMLTDGPANYDAVNIDVEKVEVNISSDSGANSGADSGTNSGWQTVNLLRPGVYNLLKFSNGIDTLLAAADLPAGTISQMRLTLGDNNSVVIDSQSFPLKTPSAQQSRIEIQYSFYADGGNRIPPLDRFRCQPFHRLRKPVPGHTFCTL